MSHTEPSPVANEHPLTWQDVKEMGVPPLPAEMDDDEEIFDGDAKDQQS